MDCCLKEHKLRSNSLTLCDAIWATALTIDANAVSMHTNTNANVLTYFCTQELSHTNSRTYIYTHIRTQAHTHTHTYTHTRTHEFIQTPCFIGMFHNVPQVADRGMRALAKLLDTRSVISVLELQVSAAPPTYLLPLV